MTGAFRAAVLTVSDSCSRGEAVDLSGPECVQILENKGFTVVSTHLSPDDADVLVSLLAGLCDCGSVDLVVTTGGTGLSPRDVTPEATRRVGEREVPGIPELMRAEGVKLNPRASLSRGVAVIRKRVLVINLPGSVRAVRECLEAVSPVLEHALETLTGRASRCGG